MLSVSGIYRHYMDKSQTGLVGEFLTLAQVTSKGLVATFPMPRKAVAESFFDASYFTAKS